VTTGDDLSCALQFLVPGATSYSATDVVRHLTGSLPLLPLPTPVLVTVAEVAAQAVEAAS